MIRIDEIYTGVFLPNFKGLPWRGIHWFHPFGSVEFEDMCNAPFVPGVDHARRYLFWDQEPLHRNLVDNTISQFKENYNGEHGIVTSEYNSENVEYVCNTYGFKSYYYFFHGWAALDWYRGYNRSLLMVPADERQITATFISPNRIIGGARNHRLILMYHILKNKMMANHISFPAICPVENIPVLDAIQPLKDIYPDIEYVFKNKDLWLPMEFRDETGSPMHSCQLSLFKESSESLLYLVTETVATGRRYHLTEKTFKPICLQMPFIIAGTQGSLRYLRGYGFKTFSDIWDESYDDEPDDILRLEKISTLLKSLDQLTVNDKNELFSRAKDICLHNYNHFYNGGFESILWDELSLLLRSLRV